MASHLNPTNWQSHVCNFSQLIHDIRHAGLTWLLGMKVEIDLLPTLPTSFLRTSSPTSGGPLAPSGSFFMSHILIIMGIEQLGDLQSRQYGRHI